MWSDEGEKKEKSGEKEFEQKAAKGAKIKKVGRSFLRSSRAWCSKMRNIPKIAERGERKKVIKSVNYFFLCGLWEIVWHKEVIL